MTVTLVLFHNNFRVADNRALAWAAARGPVVPVVVRDEAAEAPHAPGGASRWWLHHSIQDLQASLAKHGASLVLRRGGTVEVLHDLVAATGATAVTWTRRYEPHLAAFDAALEKSLTASGVEVVVHEGFLLFDPASLRTGSGTPFKVFTPFSKACFAAPPPPRPIDAPKKIMGVNGVAGDVLETWKLVPRTAQWPKGLAEAWTVGEQAAHDRLHQFLRKAVHDYKDKRDVPSVDGTSRLSPYLHFGQISPHQIWYAVQHIVGRDGLTPSLNRFLLEILWREFSWHLLHQFPALPDKPLVPSFAAFPWRDDEAGLRAWQAGQTGYPIIDAGMRQLWQTGWMHNRVRMIVASFLIKDLLIDWRAGEAWFWDTLVDADLGSNAASWQWVAGCGADAAPFFRVFNPMLQGMKFDPDGDYVRRFVPELAKMPGSHIHEPWAAPSDILAQAGVVLGQTYPAPIIDHDKARKRALAALKSLKGAGGGMDEPSDLFG